MAETLSLGTASGEVDQISALRALLEERDLRLDEMAHRMKNNMQMVLAYIQQQALSADSLNVRSSLEKVADRVRGLVLASAGIERHAVGAHVDLGGHLRDVANAVLGLHDGRISAVVDCERVLVPVSLASAVSIITNELLTNSCKYAYPAGQSGAVRLALRKLSALEAEVVVADDGIGYSSESLSGTRKKLGLRLIRALADRSDIKFAAETRGGAFTRLAFAIPGVDRGL